MESPSSKQAQFNAVQQLGFSRCHLATNGKRRRVCLPPQLVAPCRDRQRGRGHAVRGWLPAHIMHGHDVDLDVDVVVGSIGACLCLPLRCLVRPCRSVLAARKLTHLDQLAAPLTAQAAAKDHDQFCSAVLQCRCAPIGSCYPIHAYIGSSYSLSRISQPACIVYVSRSETERVYIYIYASQGLVHLCRNESWSQGPRLKTQYVHAAVCRDVREAYVHIQAWSQPWTGGHAHHFGIPYAL